VVAHYLVSISGFFFNLDGRVENTEFFLSANTVDVSYSSFSEIGSDVTCHDMFSTRK